MLSTLHLTLRLRQTRHALDARGRGFFAERASSFGSGFSEAMVKVAVHCNVAKFERRIRPSRSEKHLNFEILTYILRFLLVASPHGTSVRGKAKVWDGCVGEFGVCYSMRRSWIQHSWM